MSSDYAAVRFCTWGAGLFNRALRLHDVEAVGAVRLLDALRQDLGLVLTRLGQHVKQALNALQRIPLRLEIVGNAHSRVVGVVSCSLGRSPAAVVGAASAHLVLVRCADCLRGIRLEGLAVKLFDGDRRCFGVALHLLGRVA